MRQLIDFDRRWLQRCLMLLLWCVPLYGYAETQAEKIVPRCKNIASQLKFITNPTLLTINSKFSNQSNKRYVNLMFKSDASNSLVFEDKQYAPITVLLSLCLNNCDSGNVSYKMFASYDFYNQTSKHLIRVIVPVVEGKHHSEFDKLIYLLQQSDQNKINRDESDKKKDLFKVRFNPDYFLPKDLTYCHLITKNVANYKATIYHLSNPIGISPHQYQNFYKWASNILAGQKN
jgi:hypothetical protein